jgi:DNA polymerase-3 subunit gamma/tau
MSYLVLARKYRPQNFTQVYAQEHITNILKNSIQSNRIAQAYLFTGTRGVGKTSMARILAKSLNCLTDGPTITPCDRCENCLAITQGNSPDVVEIDGASNTGVDDIRDLQRELMYVTANALYKIYIIDEVHMLSKSAFNALLKTLEEPPKNVIFIFATTEAHKVLPTIISRCQRFDFKRIPIHAIIQQLQEISVKEKIQIEEEALYIVAKKADGSMRDALSLLDQIFAYGRTDIKTEDVLTIFGIIPNDIYNDIATAILKKQAKEMLQTLHKVMETGNDFQEFINGFLDYLRYLLLLKLDIDVPEITTAQKEMMTAMAITFSENDILYIMSLLIQTKMDLKSSINPLLIAEMSFLRLTKLGEMHSIKDLIEQIKKQPAHQLDTPALHLKRTERKLHVQAVREMDNIVKSVENEKPKLEKLTDSVVNEDYPQILDKIKQANSNIANYLKMCTISQIYDKKIIFVTQSSTQFNRLKDESAFIADVFSNHYHVAIKIEFKLEETEQKAIIKNPTLEDIRKESPQLAEFIETIDPKAEIISESLF